MSAITRSGAVRQPPSGLVGVGGLTDDGEAVRVLQDPAGARPQQLVVVHDDDPMRTGSILRIGGCRAGLRTAWLDDAHAPS